MCVSIYPSLSLSIYIYISTLRGVGQRAMGGVAGALPDADRRLVPVGEVFGCRSGSRRNTTTNDNNDKRKKHDNSSSSSNDNNNNNHDHNNHNNNEVLQLHDAQGLVRPPRPRDYHYYY